MIEVSFYLCFMFWSASTPLPHLPVIAGHNYVTSDAKKNKTWELTGLLWNRSEDTLIYKMAGNNLSRSQFPFTQQELLN